VIAKRDEFLFRDARWDAVPVRAMRERQVRQLVRAGTFHAKLSPGALVDVEYLVQLLQLAHGGQHPSVRTPNTLEGLAELVRLNVIPEEAFEPLRSAYLFYRRLIDALRMARGSADDLTLPAIDEELFAGLARRLNCTASQLSNAVEEHAGTARQTLRILFSREDFEGINPLTRSVSEGGRLADDIGGKVF
jgi:glutamate-ammonia-ligase adenylyltransferase